jgi:acyl-CoA synthetase (AMP-forming)/AMP-acid ligase II
MLGELAGECARRFGDTPVYVSVDGWSLSYRDLDRLSNEVAAGLRRRGIGAGDVVALALPAIPEYPVAYLAAAKVGAITAGVNHRLAGPERAAALGVAGPKLTLATHDLAPDNTTVEEVSLADNPGAVLAGLRHPDGDTTTIADDPARPLAIVFTSGTTGTPKGVLFCNHQLSAISAIDASASGGSNTWGANSPGGRGKSLISTSTAHLGFMTKFPGNLRRGGTSYFMGTWRADEALRLTALHGMTGIAGVPTQVALMLRVPDFDRYDISSVKAIVVGGGPASPALVREARERFHAPLLTRYSCTEAGIGIGTGPTDPLEDAEVSVGRPHPGVDLALLDDDDRAVPAGEVGAVCLRSPAVMEGYWEDVIATRAAFTDGGFVRTGDLGWLDNHGRLRLAGRSKEMYVRGGYNVYPFEVESVLASHPAIAAVAIVARPDAVMGEKGVAVVVARDPGRPPELADLRSYAAPRLAAYKLPEALRVVDELPLTSMEKVDRKALFALVTQE